ncbi:MAG: metallophosphoesterase [Paenibacillaceae bacterium]|jgi:hypothetical protein|nr:metallophosphoesterase [Paenibacillaceae bacterium]
MITARILSGRRLWLCALLSILVSSVMFANGVTYGNYGNYEIPVPNWSFEADADLDGIPDSWENADMNNMLTNPGFEEGTTDWSTDGNNRNGIIDTTVSRTGTASAKITGGVTWTSFRHRDIPIEPGATYVISGFVKTQNVSSPSSKVFIHFGTKDQAGNWVKLDNNPATNSASLVANKGTHDWQKIEMEYTAAPNETYITYLRVRINSVAGATNEIVWFDDLAIRKAGGIDKTQTLAGGQSLKAAGASGDSVSTWLSVEIPIAGGMVYNIRSAVKTTLPAPLPYLSVQFRQADGGVLSQTVASAVYEGLPGAPDWSELAGKVIAPKEAQSVRIGLNVQGMGNAWFDAVRLEEDTTPLAASIHIDGPDTITITGEGGSIPYQATVWDQYNQVMPWQALRWSVDSSHPGVSIHPDSGILTVTGEALSSLVEVRAEPASGAAAAAGRKTIALAPEFTLHAVKNGGSWEVVVAGNHIGDLYAYEVQLGYDPAKVQLEAAESLIPGYYTSPTTVAEDVYFAGTLVGRTAPLQGSVPMAKLRVRPMQTADLHLKSVALVDSRLHTVRYPVSERIELPPIGTHITLEGPASLYAGDSGATVTRLVYSDGRDIVLDRGVVYSSSNQAVAAIAADGSIHALSGGATVISAVYSDLTGSYTLTVRENEPDFVATEPTPQENLLQTPVVPGLLRIQSDQLSGKKESRRLTDETLVQGYPLPSKAVISRIMDSADSS